MPSERWAGTTCSRQSDTGFQPVRGTGVPPVQLQPQRVQTSLGRSSVQTLFPSDLSITLRRSESQTSLQERMLQWHGILLHAGGPTVCFATQHHAQQTKSRCATLRMPLV